MSRRIIAASFCVCLSAAAVAQDQTFRFFFDKSGAAEQAGRDRLAPLALTNPTIYGAGRLYLYIEYLEPQEDHSGFDLRIDITGPAVIIAGNCYNHRTTTNFDRWGTIPKKIWSDSGAENNSTRWTIGSVFKVGAAGFGAKNIASNGSGDPRDVDTHFSDTDGTPYGATLLAALDVRYTDPTNNHLPAQINLTKLSGPACGFVRCEEIFLGFGDTEIPRERNSTSTLPDAYVAYCNPCDANCDGSVNQFDIAPFVALLSNGASGCSPCAADVDHDGSANQFDIQGFVDCLNH